MIHEYHTGRALCSFLEFLAWIALAVVVVLVVGNMVAASKGGIDALFAFWAAAPLLIGLVVCLLLILFIQLIRAGMDASVAAQKRVIQAEKHHEELLRSLKLLSSDPAALSELAFRAASAELETAREAPSADNAASKKPAMMSEYKDVEIIQEAPSRFVALGQTFRSIGDAEVYIDLARNRVGQSTHLDAGAAGRKVASPRHPTDRSHSGRQEPTLSLPRTQG